MKISLGVTTYKKTEALRVFLESFIKFGDLDNYESIIVADDNFPEAQEVIDQQCFDVIREKLIYVGGECTGISRNKNRCLSEFLKGKADYLLLCDDDIKFIKSGIEKKFIETGLPHVTTYLGGSSGMMKKILEDGTSIDVPIENTGNDWFKSNPFFAQFPPQAENEYVYFCTGSQGMMIWLKREVIEKIGYMDITFPGKYGFEHAIYSNRINRFFGIHPDWFAVLKKSDKYFCTQEIPNNYIAKPEENYTKWGELRENVYKGIGLINKNPGF